MDLDRFDRACERVRDEHQRTEEEQTAFEAFASRVADLAPQAPSARNNSPSRYQGRNTPRVVTVSRPADPRLERVRNAYRETVMDTSIHREEYDESLAESLAGELGPALAAGLREAEYLTPQLHTALLNATQQAQHDRAILVKQLTTELASLEEAYDLHNEIGITLDELNAAALETWSVQPLAAARDRLQTLEMESETLVQQRQELLHQRSNAPARELIEPSLCGYLYQDYEFTYPILATTGEACDHLQRCYGQIDRVLARSR